MAQDLTGDSDLKWVKRATIPTLPFFKTKEKNHISFESLDLKHGKAFAISIKDSFVRFFFTLK